MNSLQLSGLHLENALVAKLQELLSQASWMHGWSVQRLNKPEADYDFIVPLPLPSTGKAALAVTCKHDLRPSQFGSVAGRHYMPPGHFDLVIPVLAMPWVSPRLAELCRERGWSWFDLAGNHRLEVPNFLLLIQGGNPPIHERPRPTANLGTPEAGRVIRTLLMPENIKIKSDWTQRNLRNFSHDMVSLGLVNKVVRHLVEEALLDEQPNGRLRLNDPLKLLSVWREAYRFDHQRSGFFTLFQGRRLHDDLNWHFGRDSDHQVVYASFSAADIQAPHVRQAKTWLYVTAAMLDKLVHAVEAKPVDSGENLVLLVPKDMAVFKDLDPGKSGENRLPATNLVQTYVDLWRSGGRGHEAAEALLEQRLKLAWREAGIRV